MKTKGVSLFEIMITTALIGIIGTIGVASFSACVKIQTVDTGASQLAYAIKEAKHFARSKGLITSLVITAGENTFQVIANDQDLTNSNYYGALSGKLPENIIIISNSCDGPGFNAGGILVDSSENTVYDDCSIIVGYNSGQQKTLTVKGKTGEVEL